MGSASIPFPCQPDRPLNRHIQTPLLPQQQRELPKAHVPPPRGLHSLGRIPPPAAKNRRDAPAEGQLAELYQ